MITTQADSMDMRNVDIAQHNFHPSKMLMDVEGMKDESSGSVKYGWASLDIKHTLTPHQVTADQRASVLHIFLCHPSPCTFTLHLPPHAFHHTHFTLYSLQWNAVWEVKNPPRVNVEFY